MEVAAVVPTRTAKFIRTKKTCAMRSSNAVGSISVDTTTLPWVLGDVVNLDNGNVDSLWS